MKLRDINPFIRFAEDITYQSKPVFVNVGDCRIFCVTSGEAEIIIRNQHIRLVPKSLFFCCAGSSYTISSNGGCNLLILNFDLTQFQNHLTNWFIPAKISSPKKVHFLNKEIIEDCDFFNDYIHITDNPGFQHSVYNIIKEIAEKNVYFREKSSSMLKELLIDICRDLKSWENSNKAVERAISYINSNFKEKLSNKELALIAGYHEYHLNRLFRKRTGMTIHQYILDIRVFEAKRLLMNTDMSLFAIAEATGFNNNAHLSACFRQKFNCTPSEYKKKLKNKI